MAEIMFIDLHDQALMKSMEHDMLIVLKDAGESPSELTVLNRLIRSVDVINENLYANLAMIGQEVEVFGLRALRNYITSEEHDILYDAGMPTNSGLNYTRPINEWMNAYHTIFVNVAVRYTLEMYRMFHNGLSYKLLYCWDDYRKSLQHNTTRN